MIDHYLLGCDHRSKEEKVRERERAYRLVIKYHERREMEAKLRKLDAAQAAPRATKSTRRTGIQAAA
jgi:hypothetical protein